MKRSASANWKGNLKAGKGTEVIVTHEKLPEEARASHTRGWTSGLEHLDEACLQQRL